MVSAAAAAEATVTVSLLAPFLSMATQKRQVAQTAKAQICGLVLLGVLTACCCHCSKDAFVFVVFETLVC